MNTEKTKTSPLNILKAPLLVLLLGVGTVSLTGCEQDGPLEETGEKLDRAADDLGDAADDAADELEDAADELN